MGSRCSVQNTDKPKEANVNQNREDDVEPDGDRIVWCAKVDALPTKEVAARFSSDN